MRIKTIKLKVRQKDGSYITQRVKVSNKIVKKTFKDKKEKGNPIINGLGVYFGTGCDC